MAVLLAVTAPVTAPERDRQDVAAWTLRRGGHTMNWRDAGLEDNPLIALWAVRALAGGRVYADLLYGELDRLTIVGN